MHQMYTSCGDSTVSGRSCVLTRVFSLTPGCHLKNRDHGGMRVLVVEDHARARPHGRRRTPARGHGGRRRSRRRRCPRPPDGHPLRRRGPRSRSAERARGRGLPPHGRTASRGEGTHADRVGIRRRPGERSRARGGRLPSQAVRFRRTRRAGPGPRPAGPVREPGHVRVRRPRRRSGPPAGPAEAGGSLALSPEGVRRPRMSRWRRTAGWSRARSSWNGCGTKPSTRSPPRSRPRSSGCGTSWARLPLIETVREGGYRIGCPPPGVNS